ncbi:hypothetical protein VE03_05826 [Pseudogymnoascus sp. 23342-1-I1]|nr:hypothetical protein VE03_05826 [Pseudogymnoascus sp. 23342-1-I1]
MRITSLLALAALPALSLTQSFDSLTSDLPFCALGPLSIAVGQTSCGTDGACLCKDTTFITSLTAKVKAACSTDELNKVVSLATEACKSAGVNVSVPVNSTDSSADAAGWGERALRVDLLVMVGVLGLVTQAVL